MADKIKVALVGCGGMCGAHVTRLNEVPEAQVVALCDIVPAATEKMWRERYNSDKSIRRYDSFEALMKDPPKGLRAVVLVTPHTVHFPHAMLAMQKGYDVLVEKPMVTSSDHAKKLAAQIKKTGRHLQVAFQAPFSAEFAYIREVLQNDGLGELQTITAWSHQYWMNGQFGKWRHNPKLSGGGQMYDTGAHLFNSIAWLLDRPVVEVFCRLDKKTCPVDINAVMTIEWEGGILGTATISGNTPGWDQGIFLAGEKGRILTGIHGGKLEHYDAKGQQIKYPRVTQAHFDPDKNFIHCLLGVAEPRCGVRYGILHSWLMDALYESAKKNRPVKLTKPPIADLAPPRKASTRPGATPNWTNAPATSRTANPC